jgi:GT2 family glycosyltransferase
MDKPRVSIIILNYQRGADTLECLESVSHIDYPSYEIIVVDNASTDNSLSEIRKKYPRARIIENKRNLGFAEGNNVAIKASDSPYVLLLNDDVVVEKTILKDLVEAAETDPKTGIAGPMVLYFETPDRIWSAGGKVNLFGYTSHLGKGQRMQSCRSPRYVDYVIGCAILIKREVFNKIGLLDSEYFYYFEDTDYCFRARKAGYHSLYLPSPTCRHKTKSEWITNPIQAYYYMRNGCVFAKKDLAGLRKNIFLLSQIFVMFPYFSTKLGIKNPKILKGLARGLKDGLFQSSKRAAQS